MLDPKRIVTVKDVYGREYLVSQEDLESSRVQIPTRFPDGRKHSSSSYYLNRGMAVSIHRDNIAKPEVAHA